MKYSSYLRDLTGKQREMGCRIMRPKTLSLFGTGSCPLYDFYVIIFPHGSSTFPRMKWAQNSSLHIIRAQKMIFFTESKRSSRVYHYQVMNIIFFHVGWNPERCTIELANNRVLVYYKYLTFDFLGFCFFFFFQVRSYILALLLDHQKEKHAPLQDCSWKRSFIIPNHPPPFCTSWGLVRRMKTLRILKASS